MTVFLHRYPSCKCLAADIAIRILPGYVGTVKPMLLRSFDRIITNICISNDIMLLIIFLHFCKLV